MTFSLIGLAIGFLVFVFCLWLVDYIARRRGLGGAHPLSPAMAYAALLGMVLMIGLFIGGIHMDRSAHQSSVSDQSTPPRQSLSKRQP